ncbi:MAG: DMT family transporter [Clostridiales bacterium]|nr:DMT family transporter [Clostridiales bacterium]
MIGLVFTTVVWGSGFVVMKNSVDIIPPIYLMGFRFTIASLGMLALLLAKKFIGAKKRGARLGAAPGTRPGAPEKLDGTSGASGKLGAEPDSAFYGKLDDMPDAELGAAPGATKSGARPGASGKPDLRTGALIGFWLFLSYAAQTYGLKYTTASNNAFITTFYIIIVPFLNVAANKARLRARHMLAALTALAGLSLLALDGSFSIHVGDLLTLACSFCYAVHIVLLDRHSPKYDPAVLTAIQMCAAAALCWIAAPIFEGAPPLGAISPAIALSLLYLGIFSTMLGFLLQTFGQKYLPAMAVAILLTLECVFGALFSVIFLGDPLTLRILAGFALMFAAIVITVTYGARRPESESRRTDRAGDP